MFYGNQFSGFQVISSFVSCELTLAEYECDKDTDILLEDGNMGLSSDFGWLGLLKVFLNDGDEDQVAVTGVVLITPCYALASADDIVRIPKHIFKNDTKVVFVADGDEQVSYPPLSYLVHPEYQLETYTSIALLELDIGNESLLLPVCLPTMAFDATHLYLTGFTDENELLEKMFYRVTHTAKPDCDKFYEKEGLTDRSRQPVSYVCGQWQRDNTSCVCETGMALVSNSSEWFTLIGFSVYGPGCAAPARFINMLYYLPWIQDVIHDLHADSDESEDDLSSDHDFDTEYVPIHKTFTNFNVVPNDYRYRSQQYALNQKINRRFGIGRNDNPDIPPGPYLPGNGLRTEDLAAAGNKQQGNGKQTANSSQPSEQPESDQEPNKRFGQIKNTYGPDSQNTSFGPDPRLWPPEDYETDTADTAHTQGNAHEYNYGQSAYYGPTHLYPNVQYFGPNEYFWPYLPAGQTQTKGAAAPFIPADALAPKQLAVPYLQFTKWPFPVDTLQHFRIVSAYYDPSILFIVTLDSKTGLYGAPKNCYAKTRILKYQEEFKLNLTENLEGHVVYKLSTYDLKRHGITCVALQINCQNSSKVHIAFREESIASFLYDAEDMTQPTPDEVGFTEKIRTKERDENSTKYRPEYLNLGGVGIRDKIITYELGVRFHFKSRATLKFKLYTSPKVKRGVYDEWRRPFYKPGKPYRKHKHKKPKRPFWLLYSLDELSDTVREESLVAEQAGAVETASEGGCTQPALKLVAVACLLTKIFI